MAGSAFAPVHRLTWEDVAAMVAAGILTAEDRVELQDGVLVEMAPPSGEHSGRVEWLNRHFVRTVADELAVRVQDALILPNGDFYEPDLMVIDRIGLTEARAAHLVVEVAVTSRPRDDEKAHGYARAGVVEELWIVDPARREVVVHREPRPDGFADVHALRDGDELRPPFEGPSLAVTAVLDAS